jgi:muramoyltetrapeptide carboxypeptidase
VRAIAFQNPRKNLSKGRIAVDDHNPGARRKHAKYSNTANMQVPHFLSQGSRVHVVAPSSPFDVAAFQKGVERLAAHFSVSHRNDLFEKSGFFAGDDARRTREMQDAVDNPAIDAILAARGGYGALRMLDALDFEGLRRKPKWIIGFSDITNLHARSLAMGVCAIHGPMAAWLGTCAPQVFESWRQLVAGVRATEWRGLRVVRGGEASGVSFGGNLTTLFGVAAAGKLAVPREAIWFLEDTQERPYRVDRMLTALQMGGYFQHSLGIVFGDFLVSDRDASERPFFEPMFSEWSERLAIPVVTGAPFGHGDVNEAFILGAPTTLVARDEAVVRISVPK